MVHKTHKESFVQLYSVFGSKGRGFIFYVQDDNLQSGQDWEFHGFSQDLPVS